MPFYNCALGKKGCARVIDDCYAYAAARDHRPARPPEGDRLQAVDARGPVLRHHRPAHPREKQALLDESQKKADRVEKNYDRGIITARERYNQLLDIWSHCREEVTKELDRDAQARPSRRGRQRTAGRRHRRQAVPQPRVPDEPTRAPAATSARCSSSPACVA
jgi:DNA-directed RNA polymerase subunit beta'